MYIMIDGGTYAKASYVFLILRNNDIVYGKGKFMHANDIRLEIPPGATNHHLISLLSTLGTRQIQHILEKAMKERHTDRKIIIKKKS